MKINDIVFDGVSTTPWRVIKVSGEFITCEIYGDPDTAYFVRTKKRNQSYWLPKPYFITVHNESEGCPIAEVLADSEPEVRKEILKLLLSHKWDTIKSIKVNCDDVIVFEYGKIVKHNSLAFPAIALYDATINGAIAA